MNKQLNRKAIWISAVITLLVLGLLSFGIFGPTQLFASGRTQASATIAPQARPAPPAMPSNVTAGATDADTQALIAEYQAKLDQAYQALQDAYAQIQALQQTQGQGGDVSVLTLATRITNVSSEPYLSPVHERARGSKMSDSTQNKRSRGSAGRPSTGIGPAWKSGILAGGMGAVILGWTLLIKASGPVTVAPEPAQVSMASTTLNTVSTPAAVTGATPRTTLRALPAMPTMPEKPVFQGPVTRTRRS